MIVSKEPYILNFDLAIIGLGYESRATQAYIKQKELFKDIIVIGYNKHTDVFYYNQNKALYEHDALNICEGDDIDVFNFCKNKVISLVGNSPINVFVDITVMSRHRLATIILMLIKELPNKSKITISYSPSEFIPPSEQTSPIKIIDDISHYLGSYLGDLSLPTSLILGLGYEKDKALGLCNYLDVQHTFLFSPKSSEIRFEEYVYKNNQFLIESIGNNRVFYYSVESPYTTYLDLKHMVLSLSDYSRPLLIPLGPKILSAISVIIGYELSPKLPVWRASSEHNETPQDRPPSGNQILLSLEI
ncbi:hypothetical protein [Aeromonas sp. s3]|uniref:hypothetical protein n=1 Tax=Aeromonas TaxID=642 RepID=UPI0034A1D2E9